MSQDRNAVVSAKYSCGPKEVVFTSDEKDTLVAWKQVQKGVNEYLYAVANLPVPQSGEEELSDEEIRFDQSSSTTLFFLRLISLDSESAEEVTKKPRLVQ